MRSRVDALESLFHAPAMVIEGTEVRRRIRLGVEQIRHQCAQLPVGRDVADQAHGGGGARQLVGTRVPCARRRQGDHPLGLVRAQEVGHAAPLTGIDAQTECQAALRQRRGHCVADVAAVEHEQIAHRFEDAQRLEQHLSLGAIGRMQTGVQREFGPRQKQRKRIVIGRQRSRLARRHAQARCVSGHHATTIPARGVDDGARPLE